MLNADTLFLKCQELIKELHPVSVPHFPAGLFVRMIDAQERSDFELSLVDKPSDDPGGFRASLIKFSVMDENGKPFFADYSQDQIKTLPASVTEPLVEKSMALNGFSKRDQEELEKKLAGDGSSSL